MDLYKKLPRIPRDDMTGEERQYQVKSFIGCDTVFPEFRSNVDKRIADDREKQYKRYVYTQKAFEFEAACQHIPENFDPTLNFTNFPSEYRFEVEETFEDKVIYKHCVRFLFDYGGFLWDNVKGFLFAILSPHHLTSPEFKEIHCKHLEPNKFNWKKMIPWDDEKYIEEKLEIFFKYLLKDETKFYVRYMNFFQEELMKRDGILFLFPDFTDCFDEKYITMMNAMLFSKLSALPKEMNILDVPPSVPVNIRLPDDRPSLEINTCLPPIIKTRDFVHGIMIFKVLKDRIEDEQRMTPQKNPYVDSASYDPPVLRGVFNEDQPYRYAHTNTYIDYDDISNDTMSMRKIVTCDFLTRVLDWAATKCLPLPPLNSEVYLHIGDIIPEDAKDFYVGAYSRKRKDSSRVALFPDYSYQIFTTGSRFNLKESSFMSWEKTRDYIIENTPEKPTLNNIFFRGNNVCLVGIRKDLWYMQKMKYKNLPFGTLKIEIPALQKEEFTFLPLAEMGKYKALLDLPGYGMWSTRLKFVSLTNSVVIRIIYYTYFWDSDKNKWIAPDLKKDIWETFTDTFLPVEFTHTIFGYTYSEDGLKYRDLKEERKQLNIKEKNIIMDKIVDIYKRSHTKPIQDKNKLIRDRARSLTDDDIMRYTYELIMRQVEYYGFQ